MRYVIVLTDGKHTTTPTKPVDLATVRVVLQHILIIRNRRGVGVFCWPVK